MRFRAIGANIRLSAIATTAALLVATTLALAQDTVFPLPTMNGAYVDWCATWATNCGQGGADLFCQKQGYSRATRWSWGYTDRTYVIGSNQFCEARGACGGLKDVACAGSTSSSGNDQNFGTPQMNGAYVDWCASWATNCGQGGADLFCQKQGYSRAARWAWGYADRTYVIGSNQFCDARGACGALKDVVCTRGNSYGGGGGNIQVTSATYGLNCGAVQGNATVALQQACNGRGVCDYKVDYTVLGDPANGCQKNFVAYWSCGGVGQGVASAPPEAGYGSVVRLTCPMQ